MRLGKQVTGVVLAVALVAAPASSAPRALGLVLHAQKAQIGRAEALTGATVFAGEALSTSEDGTLRVRVADAQLYLLENSAATFDEQQGWNVAALTRGGVGFATSGKERVVVRGSGAQIYAATAEPTHGEVTLVGPNELLVTSYKGPLEVMVGSDVIAVPAATAYRVALEQPPQEVEGVGKEKARRARVVGVITGVTITAAIVTLILLKNAISPSIP